MAPDPAPWKSAIYNAAWWVRYYAGRKRNAGRAQAINRLGLTVRHAFNTSEDYEGILTALIDALNYKDNLPF